MNDVYKNKAPYTLKEKRAIVGLDTLKTLENIVEKYMTEYAESVSACEVDAFCELKNHINACECVPEKWESTERMGLKEDFCVLVNGCKYLVTVQEREDSGTWQNVTVDFAEGNSMKRMFSVTGLWRYELWPSLAFDTAIRYHDLMQKQETGR